MLKTYAAALLALFVILAAFYFYQSAQDSATRRFLAAKQYAETH